MSCWECIDITGDVGFDLVLRGSIEGIKVACSANPESTTSTICAVNQTCATSLATLTASGKLPNVTVERKFQDEYSNSSNRPLGYEKVYLPLYPIHPFISKSTRKLHRFN